MALKSDARVAKRYAAALFDAVSKEGEGGIDGAAADLGVVEEMLKNVPYLRAVLMQPLVTHERKASVVTEAFQSRLGPATFQFLLLLIRKRRETLIDEAIADFRRLADENAGRIDAYVEGPVALSDEQFKRLQAALEQRTGKHVQLHASINSHMLGGLRVRIGDSIIDGALRSRLERIHQQLRAAR